MLAHVLRKHISSWVLFLQIETASIGDNFGYSRLNNGTKGCDYVFWMNRTTCRIQWGWIDQASCCEVGGRQKQDMPPHLLKLLEYCRRLIQGPRELEWTPLSPPQLALVHLKGCSMKRSQYHEMIQIKSRVFQTYLRKGSPINPQQIITP
jgi:hypothetical protein